MGLIERVSTGLRRSGGPSPVRLSAEPVQRYDMLSAMERQRISSGAAWEPVVGYSRAVRVGLHVAVSGTTAAAEGGGAVGGDDVAAQTREALRRIALALEQAGARLEDVVRTRIYVIDIRRWEEVGRVHGAGAPRPSAVAPAARPALPAAARARPGRQRRPARCRCRRRASLPRPEPCPGAPAADGGGCGRR